MLAISCWHRTGPLDEIESRSRAFLEAQSYQALRRDLERAVRRVCPRALAEDAEDLVQESLIRLIRARKFDSPDALSPAYLKKVAYSAVIDEIRRRRRQPVAETASDIDIDEAASHPEAPPTPDTLLGNAMEACLQRLSPDRRRALTLHLLGYSGKEVALILGCDSKRAENLTLRGLAQMRGHLLDMGLRP